VPKVATGTIRREQICRAAAAVISREGFAGTTMKKVADEAGVSTGMVNHYFVNRQDLLTKAVIYVSERAQERIRLAIADVPAGRPRLVALLDSALGEGEEITETWRVWINAYGEALRLPELRHTIRVRRSSWHELIDFALEEVVPADPAKGLSWSWRFDALLNGFAIKVLTSESAPDHGEVRGEVIRMLLLECTEGAAGSPPRGTRVAVGG
jgi:TetR/AcrR family transcriptional repressor of bet genes